MDPDANIAAQRELIARLRADPGDQDARTQLADLSQALWAWIEAAVSCPPRRTGSRSPPQATRCGTTDQPAPTHRCRAWGMPVPRPGYPPVLLP